MRTLRPRNLLRLAFGAAAVCGASLATPLGAGAHLQAVRSIELALEAPARVATAAFGPVGEKDWAPEWSPRFAYPSEPQDVEGAVFETGADADPAIWTLQTFDVAGGVVRYVVVEPGKTVTTIAIVVKPVSPHTSTATVTYAETGLGDAGDTHVEHFAAHFAAQRSHWEAALNAYFERARGAGR